MISFLDLGVGLGLQLVAVSLAFGFTIMVLAHMIGHISGGHINPAVTLALVITKRIDPVKAVAYVGAQVCHVDL